MAPSRHDLKIVDWDVKPQHKQTKHFSMLSIVDNFGYPKVLVFLGGMMKLADSFFFLWYIEMCWYFWGFEVRVAAEPL